MTTFCLPIKILFQHCDPAGIVFYPRYFEMINQTVEEWFEQCLVYPFATMLGRDGRGIPTVSLAAEFLAVSRLGEVVEFELSLTALGRTSATLAIAARCGGELRLTASPVLVHIDKTTGRPVPWQAEIRDRMTGFLCVAAE